MVASVYGMNFHNIPELDWAYGYPFALLLMLGAAILPYTFFKWVKWL
jgi:magnesium transporter